MNGAVPSCSGMYTTGTALSISIPLSFIFNNNSSVGGPNISCSVCTLGCWDRFTSKSFYLIFCRTRGVCIIILFEMWLFL